MDTFLTLNQLQQTLKQHNILPRKELGQNFLIDRNIRDKILSFAEIAKDDIFVEIGPGLGALTGSLVERASFVYAYEKDKKLASILKARLSGIQNVRIEEKDFLELEWNTLKFKNKIKIIGNLPYYIATPILFELLKFRQFWKMAVVMIPEDVAKRIVAKTGDKNFGFISAVFALLTSCSICYRIPCCVFYPEPEIKSVVMKIIPKAKTKIEIKDPKAVWSILPRLFVQRRKTILNVLSKSFRMDKKIILSILESLQINPVLRSHQLKLEEVVKIAEQIAKMKEIQNIN
ncbi:MAG: 16S rRNA (adenine(1518)-N(6)/adenine(1519)-N(6))-dimethyltransferase RsmA [Candidatus Omnitrophica bacterium]|nr:16S rRNA (adenine(1518)-N(6)/adenine(1519)-N(6))-dimethyltransferase RsmA [Candidatus Omnitrophota bacterium]MCM8824884.1 16S rRNA (adenine(1518)-N(6)/adenine(1519)-N(6))-dimethyltransferase RsmA [Candidatus Omnitrophota bacterium]